ncbi:MFS transporter [Sphaerisporangium krabiense]|uniref:EmrB/QacA subfamily drug resistance transporter n=1 Tax=Sphaerisporangium krabiense TaxID=763782 RepID=A0A7W9DU32_9ACTN|nr:DHA2 family efflux MFS transporter permease subunit [Sphaerisporangium krabiense]MBB5631266.1 EmrB/QacA subfamily drug resistance transporter [Sphaerisporangium krabiense]GII61121.1 MFS transporter [Sphaerisporangium krabiense]
MSTSARSRTLALAILCAGMLMIVLDGVIVTVALPAMQRDLGFTPSGLTWTVNAYMIAFGGSLLLAGRLGDLVGRRHVFVAGLAIFSAASALCGLASGPEMLIAVRFLQGLGGAMASAVSLGMIVTLYPEPAGRAKAFGAFSFVGAGGASLGQVLGGVLTQGLSWHWIFFVNVPIGVLAIVLAVRVLPADRGLGLRAGADLLGAALVTAGLMLGVYTIVEAGGRGWASAHTLGFGAVSAVLLTAFVVRQARAEKPLLPLRVFASRNVTGANVIQALMVSALFSFQVLIALYMQNVLGYSAGETGLAMLPCAAAIAVVTLLVAAPLIARFGERRVLVAGLALLTVGIGLLTRLPAADARYVTDLLPTMLSGAGFGLAITALTTLAMSAARPDDAGLASGLFNTTQQVGGAVGLAVLGTIAAASTDTALAGGAERAAALTGGFHLAFTVATGLLLASLVLALTVLRGAPPAAAPADAPAPETARA